MTKFHFSTALAIASVCLTPLALGQQSREKPNELDILSQYVGNWTSDVTSKPAVWTPEEKKFRTSNHAEFVLDGWFVQHIEVNHVVGDPERVTKALWFQTFDPRSEAFVMWFFQSTGMIGKATGTWNQKDKSLLFTPTELPPNATGKHTEAFPNDRTITGSYLITETDRRTLFDMAWTRKRQAGVAGQPTQERWANIGTPIEPIPAEVKKLDAFIGDWDAEFIQRPSVVAPNGNTSKGTMTGQWILDGRFLLGTSQVGNHNSKWVIGYDTNKKAYRYIRFTNSGQIDESIGQWNEETRSFVWKLVMAPSGISRTSTNRIVGKDAIHAHILAENGDGEVHMDLAIRSTRRK
jgi:hypothetical protein